jgi:hypothetical protein
MRRSEHIDLAPGRDPNLQQAVGVHETINRATEQIDDTETYRDGQ